MKRLILFLLILSLWVVPGTYAQEPAEGAPPTAGPATDDVTPTPPLPATATAIPPSATATTGPVDGYEPDNRPLTAKRLVQDEVQSRTFYSPLGRDVDWVVVHLKPGYWRIAARTTTGHYDPRLQLGEIIADDEEGKNALLDVAIAEAGDRLLKVDNRGVDGAGQYTLSLQRLAPPASPTIAATYTPWPTYTPVPLPTSTPVILPTATPYPTYTPLPTVTGSPVVLPTDPTSMPYPTQRPYPTAPPAAPIQSAPSQPLAQVPPRSASVPASSAAVTNTGESQQPATPDETGADSPQQPLTALTLEVFLDVNRDGLMNWGEETEGVLVVATVPDRSWETEAYVAAGE
ncbi:MAG: hypothetical protein KDD73_13420, partial [Anaerolineales bacterium]|nr:hypothetical protein [Anaerolineales bacterium]